MANFIDWKLVKKGKLPVIDVGTHYEINDGRVISFGSRDSAQAQRFLQKYSKKKTTPPRSGKIFNNPERQGKEFKRDPGDTIIHQKYVLDELERAEKDHDWEFPMSMKLKGINNETKWFTLTKREFQDFKTFIHNQVV